jgi:DNA-directed RNA polymerase specialized sigma24 family protein
MPQAHETETAAAQSFEEHRRFLLSLAYRMLGSWLPEPLLEAEALSAETASEYADDLSVGLMLALERLSPLERAAFK